MPELFTQSLELKALHFYISLTLISPHTPHISQLPYSCKGTVLQIKLHARAKKVDFHIWLRHSCQVFHRVRTLSPFISFTNFWFFEKSFTWDLHVIHWLSSSKVRGGFGVWFLFHLRGFHQDFMVIWLDISTLCSRLSHCKQYPYWERNLSNKKAGDGSRHIPSVVFISCTLAAMHAGGCWLGLADHSNTERTNRCSVAFPNRGDLTRSNLARSLGSWWSWRKRSGQRQKERYRKKTKKQMDRGRKMVEDKERQTERGVGGGRRVFSPEGSLLVSHSTGPSNVWRSGDWQTV